MARKTTPAKTASKSGVKEAASKTKTPKKAPAAKQSTAKTKPARKRAATATSATPKKAKAPALVAVPPREMLRRKELIDQIAEDNSMPRGEARRAVDVVLAAMAKALRNGQDIGAQPLGAIRVKREQELDDGKLLVCRLRMKDAPEPPRS